MARVIRNLGRLALALFIAAVSTVDRAHPYGAETCVPNERAHGNAADSDPVDGNVHGSEGTPDPEGEQHVDLGAPPVFLVDLACKSFTPPVSKFTVRTASLGFDQFGVHRHLPYQRSMDAVIPHDVPPSRLGTSSHLAHGPPAIKPRGLCASIRT